MKKYFEQHFLDFILCFLISSGLSTNVFAGYDMHDPWSRNLFAASGAALLVMAAFFAAHHSRIGVRISIPVTTAALIAAVAALYYTGAFSGAEPIDGNPILFWIIVIAVSTAVFWTARTRAGIIILFLGGTLMTAAFDLLKYPVSIRGYFVFIAGTFALFLCRVHSRSMSHSGTGNINSGAYFIQPIVISLIAILLAGGVYYGVVKPFAPPADEIELAQKLMSMQILEDAGISSKKVIIADKPEDSVKTSQNLTEVYKKKQENYNEKDKEQKNRDDGGKVGNDGNLINVMAITYERNANKIWSAAAVLVLIFVSAVMIKLLLRKKWYSDLQKKTNEDGAIGLLPLLCKEITKSRIQKAGGPDPA